MVKNKRHDRKVNESIYNSIMTEIARIVRKRIDEGYEGWTSTSDFADIPSRPVTRQDTYGRLSLGDFQEPTNNQKWVKLFPVLNLKFRGQIGTAFIIRYMGESMEVQLYRNSLADLFDAFSVYQILFGTTGIRKEYNTSIHFKYKDELRMLYGRYIDVAENRNVRYTDDIYKKADNLVDAIMNDDVNLDNINDMIYMMMVRVEEKV